MFRRHGSVYHVKKIPPLRAPVIMDMLSRGGLSQWCLFHFPSLLPENLRRLFPSALRECSCFVKKKPLRLHPWASASRCPAAFPLRTSADLWHFLCQCLFVPNPGFFIKDRLRTCASRWRLFTFFMWQLFTESVIQQKWGNKTIVTYASQLGTKHFPQCRNISY